MLMTDLLSAVFQGVVMLSQGSIHFRQELNNLISYVKRGGYLTMSECSKYQLLLQTDYVRLREKYYHLYIIPPLIELWVGAILQSRCPSVRPFVRPSVHTFVTDISASTGRNDFIFDICLWHGDLYHVSPFQVYRTSTSCLPCDLQMNEWGYS